LYSSFVRLALETYIPPSEGGVLEPVQLAAMRRFLAQRLLTHRRKAVNAGSFQAKFPLGQGVITIGAKEAFDRTGQNPLEFLARHAQGDWGELDPEDVAENELSLKRGFRLLSRYTLVDQTVIWIITEADRSVTTILLPGEY
jgi:hypothetical protein